MSPQHAKEAMPRRLTNPKAEVANLSFGAEEVTKAGVDEYAREAELLRPLKGFETGGISLGVEGNRDFVFGGLRYSLCYVLVPTFHLGTRILSLGLQCLLGYPLLACWLLGRSAICRRSCV